MSRVQISFLGKAKIDRATGYRKARYRFDDGREFTTAFFGLELARLMRPDKLIVLGTSGSMWDVFTEAIGDEQDEVECWLKLSEQVEGNAVTEATLAPFAERVSESLGFACELRVISYARSEPEQIGLLEDLTRWVAQGAHLTLDVTHGLRHLPMLMLAAAHFLEKVQSVRVDAIYYGALEMMHDGIVPVLELSGLLRLFDWVQALAAYDRSGNYAFLDALFEGNDEIQQALRQASFYEQTLRPGQAKARAQTVLRYLESEALPTPVRLFRSHLYDRLAWASSDRYYERQKALALRYNEAGDFSAAAQIAFEAFLSYLVQKKHGNINNFDERKRAKEEFEAANRPQQDLRWQAYLDLRDLRNALSHGDVQARKEIQSAMSSESALRRFIQERIERLFVG